MAAQFDTLTYMRQLETAGVPTAQASIHALALAEVLKSAVAHPRDVQALERSLNDKFVVVDAKFELIDERFDAIDKRFEAIDKRFDAIDRRLDALESGLAALTAEFREFKVSVKAEITLLKWMAGTSLVLSLFAVSTCVAIFSKLMQLIPH